MKRGRNYPRIRTTFAFPRAFFSNPWAPTYAIGTFSGLLFEPQPDNPFQTEIFHVTESMSKKYFYDQVRGANVWEWDWASTSDFGWVRLLQTGIQEPVVNNQFSAQIFTDSNLSIVEVHNPNEHVIDFWQDAIMTDTGTSHILPLSLKVLRFNGIDRKVADYHRIFSEGEDANDTAPRFWLE
jgi:hypothetical protein